MREPLIRMFRYVAWADRKTLEAVRALPAVQTEAVPLLAHILAAEHIWLSRLEQRTPRLAVWPTLSLDECTMLAAENETGFRAFLERLGDHQWIESISFRTTQGVEFVMPIFDILMQVVSHGTYHRGQIAKAIGRSGGTAINTDYFTFARDAGPIPSDVAK